MEWLREKLPQEACDPDYTGNTRKSREMPWIWLEGETGDQED